MWAIKVASVVMALMVFSSASVVLARAPAVDKGCEPARATGDYSHEFLISCPGGALSPDGRFAVVLNAGRDDTVSVELRDSRGRPLTHLRSLSDGMSFSVTWAPNSRWFFVNHHVGSFMDELQLFEIVGRSAVERHGLVRSAIRVATRRYPCLPPEMVHPSRVKWNVDSRRIVLFTTAAPYACKEFGRQPGDWKSLWMIGDVVTGRVQGGSVRVRADDGPLESPRDDPYSGF